MDFDAIRKEMKSLSFDVLRTDCDNFFEGVLIKDELKKLNAGLKNFLGEPVYPSKGRLSPLMQEAVAGFGGITPGQTLYYRHLGNDTIFAMLWPWQDGLRTTLKIIQK